MQPATFQEHLAISTVDDNSRFLQGLALLPMLQVGHLSTPGVAFDLLLFISPPLLTIHPASSYFLLPCPFSAFVPLPPLPQPELHQQHTHRNHCVSTNGVSHLQEAFLYSFQLFSPLLTSPWL